MSKRVVILKSEQDYWEACYVDGKSVGQAHHLGEGCGKLHFFKELCKKHEVTLDDIIEVAAQEVDDNKAMDYGSFPDLLSELEGEYTFE